VTTAFRPVVRYSDNVSLNLKSRDRGKLMIMHEYYETYLIFFCLPMAVRLSRISSVAMRFLELEVSNEASESAEDVCFLDLEFFDDVLLESDEEVRVLELLVDNDASESDEDMIGRGKRLRGNQKIVITHVGISKY